MASSDGVDGCLLQRGRSQSDPNILTESAIDLVHSAAEPSARINDSVSHVTQPIGSLNGVRFCGAVRS
ncbi:unnamed protein product [Merluccius merluccius]